MWNRNRDEGGLAVADVAQEIEVRAIDGLRSAYREQGYDQGYTRATRDIAALLVLATEEFIRSESLGEADRKLVRAFLRYAERHVEASSPAFTYVEHSLGI
jgi:hypothetical protein